jgi:hypothetical protein
LARFITETTGLHYGIGRGLRRPGGGIILDYERREKDLAADGETEVSGLRILSGMQRTQMRHVPPVSEVKKEEKDR